jgi:hypothetical protein
MKSNLWLPLGACTMLVISGCSGGAPMAPAAPANISGAVRSVAPDALGEVLSANKVTVKIGSCLPGGSSANVTFQGSGHASGPYKGTFTSKGTWSFLKLTGNDMWNFSQTYVIKTSGGEVDGTITGSGKKIKATCKEFGPATSKADLQFTLGNKKGSATTSSIRHGSFIEHLN